jgi:tetratricopeptide (TPR) repeat protein
MALKLNPNMGYVYNNLGHSYILQGKNVEAIAALRQAVALGDNNKRTHNNLGLAYALSGKIELAVQEFALTGDKAQAHALAAKIYYQRGQFKQARKYYSQALELDPESASSQRGLETSTLLAKFDAVLEQLKQTIAGSISDEPDQTARTEPQEHAPKSYANVGVEVSNGNGTSNMARNVGRYLKEKGFNIVRLTNAEHFNYPRTTLMHKPECKDASRELAEQMPEMPTVKEVKTLDRPTVQIKMVLGKDVVSHKNVFTEETK